MPRSREFDQDDVLDRAMLLFWAQGYEATSVRDLITAMGISSSSLYEAFGDKQAVFLAALARYCTIEQARVRQMADAAATPQSFVEALFTSLDDLNQYPGQTRGSFAFNTMVEFGTRHEGVTKQLLDHYYKIVDIIAAKLAEEQSAGAISSALPPLHLTHTILSTLQGLATLKSVQADFAHRQAVTQMILHLLDR
ncbi:MAG: TetR/AcrR family transcriptional regulator [Anaerolineae bacterium]|nr:TetR/AcrR family transcriptional regulator [Anaerolineae bacterium]